MTVGEKIKAVRKYLGLKQDEFAVKIGSSRSNLACVETGKVTPTSMMLICIALTFNVDREWLTDESADTSEVDHLVDTSIIDKYKRLKKNYRDFAERQLDMLLELQEKET